MKRFSLFGWIGAGAAVVIVVASVIVRLSGPADPAADVGDQRSDVEHFHDLVRDGRWNEVYAATTEPPAKSAARFAELMRTNVEETGAITGIEIESLRLLRSKSVPMLEVRETVTLTKNGATRRSRTVSYFARKGDRWLFAFSAPAP